MAEATGRTTGSNGSEMVSEGRVDETTMKASMVAPRLDLPTRIGSAAGGTS